MGNNLILIGMPGSGKSTIGKLLAMEMKMDFLDPDDLIFIKEGKNLQELLGKIGDEEFTLVEEKVILALNPANTVIAPGGSVIFSEKAMKKLGDLGIVIFLDVPVDVLENRMINYGGRGIVGSGKLSYGEIFDQRQPLYRRYADVVIDARGTKEEVLERIVGKLKGGVKC